MIHTDYIQEINTLFLHNCGHHNIECSHDGTYTIGIGISAEELEQIAIKILDDIRLNKMKENGTPL